MKFRPNSLIRIVISLSLIALLFFLMRNNIDNLLSILKKAKIGYFIVATILFFLIMVILSIRLKRVMAVQDINLPVKDVTCLNLVGFFFNNFLPTSVAGDVVKAHYTSRHTTRTIESYTSILIDRIFGLFSFILLASCALVLADKTVKTTQVKIIILAMIIIAVLLILVITTDFLMNKSRRFMSKIKFFRINHKFSLFLDAISRYRGNAGIICFAIYISIIAQVISVFVVAFLAKGLSINISLGLLFLTLPIIAVFSMLPSLNGLGIRESAYVFFLGRYVGKEEALAISILWLGTMLTISFLGGIVYFLKDSLLKNQNNK